MSSRIGRGSEGKEKRPLVVSSRSANRKLLEIRIDSLESQVRLYKNLLETKDLLLENSKGIRQIKEN